MHIPTWPLFTSNDIERDYGSEIITGIYMFQCCVSEYISFGKGYKQCRGFGFAVCIANTPDPSTVFPGSKAHCLKIHNSNKSRCHSRKPWHNISRRFCYCSSHCLAVDYYHRILRCAIGFAYKFYTLHHITTSTTKIRDPISCVGIFHAFQEQINKWGK